MNIFEIVKSLEDDIGYGRPILDEDATGEFDSNECAYFAGVEVGRRELAEQLKPRLKELAHLIQYLNNVVRPHFEVAGHAHSLGCDIAMAWIKRTNNEKLTEDEFGLLSRNLPN